MNPLKKIGNQNINQDLARDYKETYLILQRALLINDMDKEIKLIKKNYDKAEKTFLEKIRTGEN